MHFRFFILPWKKSNVNREAKSNHMWSLKIQLSCVQMPDTIWILFFLNMRISVEAERPDPDINLQCVKSDIKRF